MACIFLFRCQRNNVQTQETTVSALTKDHHRRERECQTDKHHIGFQLLVHPSLQQVSWKGFKLQRHVEPWPVRSGEIEAALLCQPCVFSHAVEDTSLGYEVCRSVELCYLSLVQHQHSAGREKRFSHLQSVDTSQSRHKKASAYTWVYLWGDGEVKFHSCINVFTLPVENTFIPAMQSWLYSTSGHVIFIIFVVIYL